MIITSETPVREIAVRIPAAIPALELHGIEYCCGGQHTLAEACTKRNIPLSRVMKELEQIQNQNTKTPEDRWQSASLKDLSEYIVTRHHTYTREQLNLIDQLMAKVEARHGAEHLEVFRLGKAVAVFSSELRHHTECEETNLFPYIAALGTGKKMDLPPPAQGSLKPPITRMMADHAQTAEELRTLRTLTNDYTPPTVACATWRALYRAIEDLDSDLHEHLHLENNILFPRALEQSQLAGTQAPLGN